jgi:hypothetical protein
LTRAGHWFLHSGIQEPSGGFARFYRSEIQKNMPVSTEISGYAASALVFLYRTTGEEKYLDGARRTAGFLTDQAWDEALRIFPYEHPSPTAESRHLAYFFDCGIIIRGLLAVWRETHDDRLLDVAVRASYGMSAFRGGRDYHPILTLPDKNPVARNAQWSTTPGCYQAKSALAWWELAAITGDEKLKRDYLEVVEAGIRSCRGFLAGADERLKVMDRLHALLYFLEALSPMLDRADCVETYGDVLEAAVRHRRELESEFVRSDVYAQTLRARIRASHVIPMDIAAAHEEAAALAEFQADSGGFIFGKRAGVLSPHVNPVSTAFAMQALEMWRAFEAGESETCLQPPI